MLVHPVDSGCRSESWDVSFPRSSLSLSPFRFLINSSEDLSKLVIPGEWFWSGSFLTKRRPSDCTSISLSTFFHACLVSVLQFITWQVSNYTSADCIPKDIYNSTEAIPWKANNEDQEMKLRLKRNRWMNKWNYECMKEWTDGWIIE